MRYAHAKMTFHMMLISFLAFLLIGCGESGTPGGASGPGVTASISLTAGATSLPADGASSTPITAVLTDSVGTAVTQQTSVVFRTNLGTFRNGSKEYKITTADATGRVIVQLTTEETAGNAEVWVESNKVKQKIEVKFYDPHKVGTISLRTGSSSITADGTSQVSIIATVNDALGNPEEGATVNFKTTLGQFYEKNPLFPGILNRNTTAVTDVDGEARVVLVSGTTIGTATILAAVNGLNASTTVVFTAGEPNTISLRAAPSTIRPNGTTNLFAKLRDINGNPVQGKTIVFSEFINASEGTLSSVESATNVNGEAQVTYTAGKDPGADIIQAALSSDLDIKATTTIVVDPGAIVIGNITVTAGAASLVADGKSKVKIRAVVTDVDGNIASGKTVNFVTTAGTLSSASATTSGIGLAEVMLQSTTISGPVTVTAECDGFIGEVSVEFIPGPAHHLIMYALPNVVPPNGAFTTAVIVQDQYDNRIDDQRLMLQVRRAGFTEIVDSAEMTPDQATDGVYRFDWTASTAYGPGDLEITAKVNNGVSKTVTVVVDENAIIVGSISVIAGATAIEANGVDSTVVRAKVLDYNGQPAQGITVDFSTTLGSLSSGQQKTDQNGFAEVILKAGTVWGTATVTADANGFKGQVEVLFTTGRAGGLSVTAMPGLVTPGGQSTVIAELRSTSGEPVAGELLYFNIYENNSNGSLSAIQAVTDTNGRATVTYTAGVEADLCGGGGVCSDSDCIRVTLASDSSINDTVCITVAIPTGVVGYMTLTSADNSLPADGISSTAVTAKVYDTVGVPMPQGTAITFSTTLGTFPGGTDPAGPITSQITLTTIDDSGTIITSLVAGTVGGVAQVKAISGGVSQVLNIIIYDGSVLVGSISLTANPASIPADGASSTAITAVVKDTLGNPVPVGTPVAFVTSLGTFPNTFTSIVVNTPDNSGTVTTSLIAGLVDGVAFVTATAGSLSQAIQVPILEAVAGGLALTANPTTLVANGTSTSLIRATLTDSNGNPMAGENVTFSTTLGTIIGGPTVITNASGIADVTLQSTTTAGTATVTATANGITATVNVTFTSGAPGSLLLTAAPSTVNPGGGACATSCCESTSTLTATLRDTEGNPMSGQTITFIMTTNQSGAGLSGPSAVTNINGQATITYTAGNTVGTDRVTARSVTDTTISDYVDIVVDASASVVGSITVTSGVSSLVANGTSQTAIRATVLNSCGNPMSGFTVNFSTTLGTLSAASAVTNASGIAQVTLTSAANTGTAKVTADASGFIASVNVAFVAGAPVSMLVTAAPSTVNPKGTSTVTATLRDVSNNPLVGETISFNLTINASGASLSVPSAVTDINGQATITYTAGNTNPVTDRVTARSVTNAAITDYVDITVDASATVVGSVLLTANPTSIPADGSSSSVITATVKDTNNAPMPAGTPVTFTTTSGTFPGGVDPDGAGPLTSQVTINTTGATGIVATSLIAAVTSGTAIVTATSSGVSQTVQVTMTGGGLVVSQIDVIIENTTLNADGVSTTNVYAYAKTALNQAVPNVAITFETSHGTITTPLTTDANGKATAVLTSSRENIDPVTVTARYNLVSDSATMKFVGVTLALTASPTSQVLGFDSTITATLLDAANKPIAGATVSFSTSNPGAVTVPTTATTNVSGKAIVVLQNSTVTGDITVTGTSSGATGTVVVNFGDYQLAFEPSSPAIINVGGGAGGTSTITIRLRQYGAPACPGGVTPVTVNFSSTLGTITNSSVTGACTAAAGYIYADATATLVSGAQGGTATINAYVLIGGVQYSATTSVSIVSPTANKILLEPDPDVISVNTGISTIRARVLDLADNPVANTIIYFRILQGPGGSEYLTPSFATTDADGRCVAYFHAGSITSDNIGDVIIQASDNQAFASPVGSCNLTISGQVHHVSVGVNLQSLPSPALTQGHLQVGVSGIAVDINGNPVADGTLVIFSVKSIEFDEDRADDGIIECWNAPGQLAANLIVCPAPLTPGFGTTWFSDDINQNGILDFAGSEDINNNGILDSGEDLNGNGVMDPPQGNLIVSPKSTTDGVATTDLIYPMQYAANIRVRITASAGGKTNFYDYYLLCTTQMVTQGTCGGAY